MNLANALQCGRRLAEVEVAVKSAQIVEFVKALRPQLKRKLLIVWDGAAQHKGHIVRGHLDSTEGAVQMALLLGYSPDLNPVEYLWAWLKLHALANFCPRLLAELKTTARSRLRSGQRPPVDHHCVLAAGRAVVMS